MISTLLLVPLTLWILVIQMVSYIPAAQGPCNLPLGDDMLPLCVQLTKLEGHKTSGQQKHQLLLVIYAALNN